MNLEILRLTFALEVFGSYRYEFVLNRMHAAALGDTLGIGISLTGLIIFSGLNFTSLKMLLVIVFLWFASPVSSHLISRLEVMTDETLQEIAMQTFTYLLMGFLVICAVSVSFSKNLLNSILIFMSYSLVMSIIWILLESPDLAITEAAVGAGVTSVLFFVTLKKIHAIRREDDENDGKE